jgi:uncharacterized protein
MIFVDTSFWYDYLVATSTRHNTARELFDKHRVQRLLTTDRVIEELWTLLRRRRGHRQASTATTALRSSRSLRRVAVTQSIADVAWEWLARHDEREYSFVDAASFEAMRRHGVDEAFAFDGDFAAAGFVELR